MLEIKGELSLLDTLQMLRVLEGSYIIRTEDAEIHVRDGNITWFSLGNRDDFLKYLSSYEGRVKVNGAPVKESFLLPIDELLLQAAFLSSTINQKEMEEERKTCPNPGTAWFAVVLNNRIVKSRNADEEKIHELIQIWHLVKDSVNALSELILAGRGGGIYMLREGDAIIIGYCINRKFLGILRQTVRRLKKHVHGGAEG